jgi:PAS domain S-box-containing protein
VTGETSKNARVETELSRVVDALPGFVWTARPDGGCDFMSQRWCEFTGLGVEHALGWGWEIALHPDDRPRLVAQYRAVLATGQAAEFEGRLRRFDGEFRRFSARIAPVTDASGRLIKWCGVHTEIEDRRQAEEAARDHQQRFQMIVDGLPAIVTIIKPNGEAVHASRHALDYFGATLEDLKQIELAANVHPDDREAALEAWSQTLATQRPFDRELRLSSADGVYRWLHVRGFPLGAPGGDVPLWYFLMTEVDEKKRAEALLAAEKQLLELVTRGRPLPEVLQALCQRVEAMTGDGFCSILLVDPGGAKFLVGAGPSLPAEYNAALEGKSIDRHYGPCSLAALARDQVIASNLNTDPRWARSVWPGLALSHGLQACWSTPILSANAELLGVLALYWREPHSPTGPECDLIKRFTHLAGLIIDRSLGDAALKASEARKAAILKSALDGVITLNHLGAITEFNPAAERMFGYRQAEVIGRTLDDVILPRALRDQRELRPSGDLAATVAHLIGKRVELIAARADGGEFPAELALTRTTSEGLAFFCAHLRDITERKKAEGELRRNEAQLAHGQALSQTGSFSWKLDTDEITFSEELYRIFEFDRSTQVTLELIADRTDPDDHAFLAANIQQARQADVFNDYEARLRMPDGRVKHVQTVSRTMRDSEGRSEVVGAVRDVTERKQSEETLSKVRTELAHVTRAASLGALTASIAHEVNQPLSGILTNARTCLRMLDADPPNLDGARSTAQRTIRDGNRASAVIQRLRALFAHRPPGSDGFDLNEAAREVLALSSSELQSRRVILQTEFAQDLPAVRGDRVQLQQVILNLVLNAADAMMGVADRPRDLLVGTGTDPDGGVRLWVRDTGVGFDPQDAERLFDAFYTTKADGMGIGLSISRSVVQSHDGRLWATPNEGPGATFAVWLPDKFHSMSVSPAPEGRAAHAAAAAPGAGDM